MADNEIPIYDLPAGAQCLVQLSDGSYAIIRASVSDKVLLSKPTTPKAFPILITKAPRYEAPSLNPGWAPPQPPDHGWAPAEPPDARMIQLELANTPKLAPVDRGTADWFNVRLTHAPEQRGE